MDFLGRNLQLGGGALIVGGLVGVCDDFWAVEHLLWSGGFAEVVW